MKGTTVLSKIRGVLPSDSAKNVDAHMPTASHDNGPNRTAVRAQPWAARKLQYAARHCPR
jgi:hypothetical protein